MSWLSAGCTSGVVVALLIVFPPGVSVARSNQC
jgi:hypothetical protein